MGNLNCPLRACTLYLYLKKFPQMAHHRTHLQYFKQVHKNASPFSCCILFYNKISEQKGQKAWHEYAYTVKTTKYKFYTYKSSNFNESKKKKPDALTFYSTLGKHNHLFIYY